MKDLIKLFHGMVSFIAIMFLFFSIVPKFDDKTFHIGVVFALAALIGRTTPKKEN